MASKILIVDDEPHLEIVIRQLFRRRIKSGELSFLFAPQGEEALRTLNEHGDIDVVFSDINMPVMNGLTLLKRLNENYPLVRTVVITAYGDMKNIRTAMNHGAFDFLNKPINFNDLKITLDKTLKHVRQIKELHDERRQRFLAEKLGEMNRSVTSTLHLDKVLDLYLAKLVEVFECEHAFVCHRKKGEKAIILAHHGRGSCEDLPIELAGRAGLNEDGPFYAGVLDHDGKTSALLELALANGNDDGDSVFLMRPGDKPFSADESQMAVSLTGEAAASISNARLFEEVRTLATTDGLTGLYNRRHFLELAGKEVVRSCRYGNPLSTIMLDLDHFKQVNDRHGHPVGDEVLQAVARVILETCRKTDISSRYGGDEMIILLIETDCRLAGEIAERLRESVAHLSLTNHRNEPLSITVSLGVAQLDTANDSLADLLERVDLRLLSAKKNGRNRVQME
ncbi:MAG: diguanylate cyclase [Acidobacteriota bacterium]|nr:diguanylate cyclase [Acidobacteriota bacterium]